MICMHRNKWSLRHQMFMVVQYQPSTLAPNDSCISNFRELRVKMSRGNWKAQRLQVCISILRKLRAKDVSEELRRTEAKNWYNYYEEELRCCWHHALEFMNNLLKNINFCISILRELRAKYVSEKSIRTEAKLLLLLLGRALLLWPSVTWTCEQFAENNSIRIVLAMSAFSWNILFSFIWPNN